MPEFEKFRNCREEVHKIGVGYSDLKKKSFKIIGVSTNSNSVRSINCKCVCIGRVKIQLLVVEYAECNNKNILYRRNKKNDEELIIYFHT